MKTTPGKKGFTLLEILAAMVLMGLILPVAMSGIAMVVRLTSQTAKQQQAIILAEQKMSEVILEGLWISSEESGDFEDYPDYFWEMTASDWTDSALTQIDLLVRWSDQADRDSVTISTIVYDN